MSCNCNSKPGCQNTVIVKDIHSDFQAVVIPSALGDSTHGHYKPKVGAYRNAIVLYQADGTAFLYDDKGRYSFLSRAGDSLITIDSALDANSPNPVQNSTLTPYIIQLQTATSTNTEDISTLSSTVSDQGSAISDNALAISDLDGRAATLEGQVSANTSDISDNASDISSIADDVDDLQTNMSTAQSDITTLQGAVSGLIAEGGEPNVIEVVQKNGSALPISNKTVNVTVPTATSDLTNDSDFVDSDDVREAIGDAIFDSTVTVADAGTNTIGTFSVNQAANSTVTIPTASASTLGLVKLVVSTVDIGEGATLAEGTIYGVYAGNP